ncbi:MAG: hypothetical protein JJLCMIEE_03515 [Acidimicrobiales bacterium]|nr:MAG: hypothetical protein EDR02_15710 [Actinomycetota bacterium]MBV6510375.1 hypothetical protein [Acidimicrobiales bacterium]RIK03212.1 MAG: hypothetical protein DCC48_17010 [Acidobacteriota bacterium]
MSEPWQPSPLLADRLMLYPVGVQHYDMLRTAEILTIGPNWRHRGTVTSPEAFPARIWSGILAQFIIVRRHSDDAVGWVQCYNADTTNGHAYVAAARLKRGNLSTDFGQGFVMFIDYLFDNWPFHKLYMEVGEFNLHFVEGGIGELFEIEGRLLDHLWAGEKRWDMLILSVGRESWKSSRLVQATRTRIGATGSSR